MRRKRERKTRKIKLTPLPKLKTAAEIKFSLFIRHRDKWTCTICGATRDGGATIQNGHYVKRGKVAVTFDEVNCNALCSGCNHRDNYYHHHYESAIRAKWGDEKVNDVLRRANDIVKDKRSLYEEVIRRYG